MNEFPIELILIIFKYLNTNDKVRALQNNGYLLDSVFLFRN